MATPSRGRGFTLIELLVAIAIMSLLALLSWRSIDGMSRTRNQTQERADALLRLQSSLGQWTADLDAIVDTGEVSPLDFDGRLLRLTRRDSTESGLTSPGMRVVAWARLPRTGNGDSADQTAGAFAWARWQSEPFTQRNELARAWQRASEWGGGASPAGSGSAIQLVGIDQWQLFYHRGDTWGNPLSSVGSESVGGVVSASSPLPNGVRLVLTLSPGQPLAGSLVRDWVRPTLEPRP
ncbi:type II secretion system protein J [Hydrogenophaga sp.]|uniref:PulJ/GspJ family protein n=1 Tax=Hydrogenophaga sp. TaxID=1904254 RepID=UPI00356A3372